MSEEQKAQLKKQLWNIANELRGKMNADEFRDYILGFIFFKYLSEKIELFANTELEHDNLKYNELEANDGTHAKLLDALKSMALDQLGYFLLPNQLFSSLAKQGNQKENNFILGELTQILNGIEKSTMGTESEDDFESLFSELDLDSQKLGRTTSERNNLITKILTHLDKIDFKLKDSEIDVLGDAYEYLISQFASGAGKKAGEFYTPQEVSQILAKLVTTGKSRLKNVYDPTCGSGSLLLRVAKEIDNFKEVEFIGQELNNTTYNLCRMNMILHDVHYKKFDIKQEDTLERPQHKGRTFEAIVANPPFSVKWSASELFNHDDRFSHYGRLAPSSKADYAFITHMIHHLSENGTMAVVMPRGVLFRGGAEGHIRKFLIKEKNYLDAVIALPASIFYGTPISTCIMVFKKCRNNEDVLFIDASKRFQKNKKQNILLPEHINEIIDTYKKRESIDKYSRKAQFNEIVENNFNINLPRYVDTFIEEEKIEMDKISAEIKQLNHSLEGINKQLSQFCDELEIESPFVPGIESLVLNRKLRFKKQDGSNFPERTEKRLGDIATFSKGKGLPKSDLDTDGDHECIHYGELFTKYTYNALEIHSRTNNKQNASISMKNDVLMPTSDVTPNGLATATALSKEGVILGGDILVIRSNLLNTYLSLYINNHKKEVMRLVSGSTVYHIYGSDMASLKVKFPCIEEQKKISDFIMILDLKISTLEKIVNLGKKWRKGVTNNLFL